ncbi:MAG: NAD-dependent epimerase/dehydratase family protein [Gammaproteobacteria bacterium]|nr:NAD-dependent epimerase/dehydratase family protein [Gammaproteobacteria bacterium]
MTSSVAGRADTVRVITGASGHIGGVLARMLVHRFGPGQVRAIHRGRRGTAADLGIGWVHGELQDAESLNAAFKGAEVVYHLAALISLHGDRAEEFHRTNVLGTRNVVAAALAAGVRRLVHVSSIHAYDQEPADEVLDESRGPAHDPHDPYGLSKAAGEVEVRRGIEKGLDAVIVNPTSVIGPYDAGPSHMGQLFLDLYRRRIPALVAGGYDWVDVRDVASATMAAETQARCGENHLVSGHWQTMGKLAELAEQATGVASPRLRFPVSLAQLWAPCQVFLDRRRGRRPLYTPMAVRVMAAGNRRVSNAKARQTLGLNPRPLAETVNDTYRWFDEHGMLDEPG